MKKNSIILSLISLILTSVVILTCGCSKNTSFEYDWTAIDNLMNENGVEVRDGTNLEILYEKKSDTETKCTLMRYNTPYGFEYKLNFEISYYSLIPDIIVVASFHWSFPYSNPTADCSFALAHLSYYENDEKIIENYKHYKSYVVHNLKFKDEQFELCGYMESPFYTPEEMLGNIELKPSNEYFLDHLLSVGFNATTEFFKNNNLPSLYVFADRMPVIVVPN